MASNEKQLIEKIRRLPPEKLRAVENFVDFLDQSEQSEEKAFMRAVVQGLADIEAGRSVSLAEARTRLGLT